MNVKMRKVSAHDDEDQPDNQIEYLTEEEENQAKNMTSDKTKCWSCCHENSAILKKLLYFGIFILVIGLGLSFGVTYGRKHILAALSWIESIHYWGIFIIFGIWQIAALPVVWVFTFACITSGFVFGLWIAIPVCWISALFGAFWIFILARYTARNWIEQIVKKKSEFQIIDRAIGEQCFKLVVLIRLCPIPFGWSNIILSATSAPMLKYMVATAIGIIPPISIYCYVGFTVKGLSQAFESGEGVIGTKQILILCFEIGGAILAVIVAFLVARRAYMQIMEKKNDELESKSKKTSTKSEGEEEQPLVNHDQDSNTPLPGDNNV